MVNSRTCKDKKGTKKCKKLLKKNKCKKKKVWKKCLKTCEKCDDSGTQINEHTQFTISLRMNLRINEYQIYLFSFKLLLCLMLCELSNDP